MKTVLLILAFLLLGLLGYRIMSQVDRFIGEHVKGEDEDEPEGEKSA